MSGCAGWMYNCDCVGCRAYQKIIPPSENIYTLKLDIAILRAKNVELKAKNKILKQQNIALKEDAGRYGAELQEYEKLLLIEQQKPCKCEK